MKAVSIQTFGDPSGMAVIDVPDPSPGPGQVLVQTVAIGVGGVDAVVRRGTLGGYGFTEGHIPGSEVAGRVIAVGDDVDAAWIGRRVWAFTGVGGAYAELAVARIADVTALPDALSSIDAVTLGSAGPVAHFALAHARFTAGDSLLIRGAAGSIGILAVQLAGSGPIAVTTSSPSRGERLRKLGATVVLDRDGNGVGPAEYDVVLDIVGGPGLPSFVDRLADNGRLVSVGVVGGYPPADFGMAFLRSFQRSRSFATFSLNTVPEETRNQVRASIFADPPEAVVHDVLPLAEAAGAHRRMDAGEVFGRIVLTTGAN
ncbi:NADPH:quinone reductase-like Zn-dependent oxidoreductase [Actinoplanes tereljensis]|uniref:Oxidoreductase n=1 Tax=Paractinoplanes tereljensis TaxID=571912 RepID=A0A919NTI2_9ACTN|nr:zinc-binding dehydrogenase [Actinoplanes tereljensis]GIF24058.1 oxidoreductase [Actinoplanes tereljensis]